MPMVSAPPGRLSTTTGWPRNFAISGAMSRARLSVALPTACGTTRRMGRSGYCAAHGHAAPRARTARRYFRLLLQLGADLAALVLGAMDVHVQVAGLQGVHLRGVQLRAGGHAVGVAVLRERNDDRAVLAGRALVDVRHGPVDAGGGHAAAHRA